MLNHIFLSLCVQPVIISKHALTRQTHLFFSILSSNFVTNRGPMNRKLKQVFEAEIYGTETSIFILGKTLCQMGGERAI